MKKRILPTFVAAFLAATCLQLTTANASQQTRVEIKLDDKGTPHIIAVTDKGAYFGAGYAAAEHRFFQMSFRRLLYQGRSAEFFGLGTTGSNPPKDKFLDNDIKMRTLGISRYASVTYASLDSEMREMLQAYADGVNAYIQSASPTFHPLFSTYGVPIELWKPEDCIGVWFSFCSYFTSSPFKNEAARYHEFQTKIQTMSVRDAIDAMTPFALCDDDAAVVQESAVPTATRRAMRNYAQAFGLSSNPCSGTVFDAHFSNTWAVDAAHNETTGALLVGDPRIDVYAPNALFEWSMVGSTFEASGVGIAGSPNLLIAHTKDVSWSVTALGMDQSDLYLLTSGGTDRYVVDGVNYPIISFPQEPILVKPAGGGPAVVQLTVTPQETIWGPVVTNHLVSDVQAGEMYAAHMVPLFEIGHDTSRGILDMIRAANVRDLYAASASWTFPGTNFLMADSSGEIGYTIVGNFPVRNPALPLAGDLATDGSTMQNKWLDNLPNAVRPHVFNPPSGYLFSANHMPIGSWYPIPFRFGTGSHGDGVRSKRLRERLTALAATGAPFPKADVFDIHHDTVNVARRDFVEIGLLLQTQLPSALSPDANLALSYLQSWWNAGASMGADSYETALASKMKLQFRAITAGQSVVDTYGGGENGLMLFQSVALDRLKRIPPVLPTPAEAAFIDSVLADAYRKLPPISYTAGQLLRKTWKTWTSVDGAPSLDPATTFTVNLPVADNATLLATGTQCYTQLVDTSAIDSTQSVLAIGSSEHANNMFLQLSMWELERFKDSPVSATGVNGLPIIRTVQLWY